MTTASNTTAQQEEGILPPYASASETKASTVQPSLTTTDPLVGTLDARVGLFINEDGSLLLDGYPVRRLSQTDDPHRLLCYTKQQDGAGQPIAAGDLLAAAHESGHAQAEHQDAWLAAYVRARAALSEALTLYAVTSVGSVLKNLKGSDGFLETIDHVRATLPRLPAQFGDEETLFAACVCLGQFLKTLSDDFERGELLSPLTRVRGGQVFLEAFQQVRDALIQLPLFQHAYQRQRHSLSPEKQQVVRPAPSSVEENLFVEQYKLHQDEILRDKDSRRALMLKVLEIAGVFLSIGIVNIAGTGAVDLAYPLLSLFLAIEWRRDNDKIGSNRRFIRGEIEPNLGRYRGWEQHSTLISKLSKLLWKAHKQQKQAPFEQLLRSIEPEMRSMLMLSSDEPLPENLVIELEYTYQTPPDLLTLASRGIFLVTQLLTLIVASISVVARVIEAPTAVTSWALVGVAVIFLVIDSWAIVRTWSFVRNLR